MQVNKIQSNNQTTFGIKYDRQIKELADGLFYKGMDSRNKRIPGAQRAFNEVFRKLKYMEEHYGYNDYTLKYNLTTDKDGNKLHQLIAKKDDGTISAIILEKDGLNKIFNSLIHINQFVLTQKITEAEEAAVQKTAQSINIKG